MRGCAGRGGAGAKLRPNGRRDEKRPRERNTHCRLRRRAPNPSPYGALARSRPLPPGEVRAGDGPHPCDRIGSPPFRRDAALAESSDERRTTGDAAHRREPRHRARDRQALLGGGLARDHRLAPPVSGELPLGDGPRGPPPGRPRQPRRHAARRRGDEGAARAGGRRAARPRQQCRHLAEGRERRPRCAPSTRRSRIGSTSSR